VTSGRQGRCLKWRRLLRSAWRAGAPGSKASRYALLYNTISSVMDGGGRSGRFGIEREEKLPDGTKRKVRLWQDGSYSKDSEIQGRLSRSRGALRARMGQGFHPKRRWPQINKVKSANPDAVCGSIDLSGGIQRVRADTRCVTYGATARRCIECLGLQDPFVHREPILHERVDPGFRISAAASDAKQFRVPNMAVAVQKRRWRRELPENNARFHPLLGESVE